MMYQNNRKIIDLYSFSVVYTTYQYSEYKHDILGICYSYSTVPGIYGSEQTDSEGVAGGQGLFTTSLVTSAITIIYPT